MNKENSFDLESKHEWLTDSDALKDKVKTSNGIVEEIPGLDSFKEYNNSMENYIGLMDTFLNRRDKRKLSRYKGFKSFSDRIYGR